MNLDINILEKFRNYKNRVWLLKPKTNLENIFPIQNLAGSRFPQRWKEEYMSPF